MVKSRRKMVVVYLWNQTFTWVLFHRFFHCQLAAPINLVSFGWKFINKSWYFVSKRLRLLFAISLHQKHSYLCNFSKRVFFQFFCIIWKAFLNCAYLLVWLVQIFQPQYPYFKVFVFRIWEFEDLLIYYWHCSLKLLKCNIPIEEWCIRVTMWIFSRSITMFLLLDTCENRPNLTRLLQESCKICIFCLNHARFAFL